MRIRTKSAVAVVTAALALLVAGCGSQQASPQASQQASPQAGTGPGDTRPAALESRASSADPVSSRDGRSPKAAGSAQGVTPRPERADEVPVENVPTELPPGDPGLDAPSAPDPGVPTGDREHEEPARTTVPAEAMLDAGLVSGVLGGGWQQREAVALTAVPVPGTVAERTAAFGTDGGEQTAELVQTVATHRSLAAADRAVAAAAQDLLRRGWTKLADPRLGTASVALSSRDGSQTAVVLSAEAVTVTLVGSEGATAAQRRWVSLLDVALGSSCAAAPHGCH